MNKHNSIELVDICKSYPNGSEQNKVLNLITLSIPEGSIAGIIGKSGAGKSTLLRCLSLLERPDSGKMLIHGTDITAASLKEMNQIRRLMGFIPQSCNLLSRRTVEENIRIPLEFEHWQKPKMATRVLELANLVGLYDKLQHYPSQLSGGQKQRVAIARALATFPRVLLCDEFTSALDPKTTQDILSLIKEINQRLGVTVLLITHDMSVVRSICDHVFVIQEGTLIQHGNVETILHSFQRAALE